MSANELVRSPQPAEKSSFLAPLIITVITVLGFAFWQFYTAWLNTLPPEMLSDPSWFFLCH